MDFSSALVLVLGFAKVASACKIKSSMAFEPDSLGVSESGKMNTAFHGAMCKYVQYYITSNTLLLYSYIY